MSSVALIVASEATASSLTAFHGDRKGGLHEQPGGVGGPHRYVGRAALVGGVIKGQGPGRPIDDS